MANGNSVERFERAKSKKEEYGNELIRIKTILDNKKERRQEIIAKARELYIKDPNIPDEQVLDKLREMFTEKNSENEKNISEFEKRVEHFASQIEQIKRNANIN